MDQGEHHLGAVIRQNHLWNNTLKTRLRVG